MAEKVKVKIPPPINLSAGGKTVIIVSGGLKVSSKDRSVVIERKE